MVVQVFSAFAKATLIAVGVAAPATNTIKLTNFDDEMIYDNTNLWHEIGAVETRSSWIDT